MLGHRLRYCTLVCSTKGTLHFALCCAASKLRLELRGASPVHATLVSQAALPLRHAQLCSGVLGGLLRPSALAAGTPFLGRAAVCACNGLVCACVRPAHDESCTTARAELRAHCVLVPTSQCSEELPGWGMPGKSCGCPVCLCGGIGAGPVGRRGAPVYMCLENAL